MTGVLGLQRVHYGDDPAQFAILSLPEGEPRGVVVLIHGGFWKAAYGIEYALPLVPSLVARGWAVWTIEYRRVGNGGGVPTTLDDVRAAIAACPVETEVVVGIGHSAGGQLAVWAGRQGLVTHVVAQAAVLDLRVTDHMDAGGGAVFAFLGHRPGPKDDHVDPIRMLPIDVPVWCVHGRDDDTVPVVQSWAYVAAAEASGSSATLVEVEGDHFAVVDPDAAAWERTLEILDEL